MDLSLKYKYRKIPMKNLMISLSLLLSLQTFAFDAQEQQAVNTTKVLEKSAKVGSSLVTETAEELYQDRVTLEIALKKIDEDFAKIHKKYTKLRAKYIKDRKNKDAAKDYYTELDSMIKDLFVLSVSKPELAKQRGNLVLSLKEFQSAVLDELEADKKASYQSALKILNDMYQLDHDSEF